MGSEVQRASRNVVWLRANSMGSTLRLSFSPSMHSNVCGPNLPCSPEKVLATEQESMLTTEEWEMKVCLELRWLKVTVKPCLPINLSMLEAKVCALRDCFPPEINVL